jgi:hypothetical protein
MQLADRRHLWYLLAEPQYSYSRRPTYHGDILTKHFQQHVHLHLYATSTTMSILVSHRSSTVLSFKASYPSCRYSHETLPAVCGHDLSYCICSCCCSISSKWDCTSQIVSPATIQASGISKVNVLPLGRKYSPACKNLVYLMSVLAGGQQHKPTIQHVVHNGVARATE